MIALALRLVAQVLYLFAPLLVAAALSAVVLRRDMLHALARPIDAGAMLGGERVLGDGKTWRGVATAILGCVPTVLAQRAIGGVGWLAVVDYAGLGVGSACALGVAMAAGAMLGELPNSFVKRRLRIPRGETATGVPAIVFYVWDQIDLLTTAWPLVWAWARPSRALVAASFVVALVVHPTVALIGYLLGARRTAR